MQRPASIRRFERFYWAHMLLGLVNSVIALWIFPSAALSGIMAGSDGMVGRLSGAAVALPFITQVLLWYLIARRGNLLAKYVLAGLTGLNLLGAAYGMVGLITGKAGVLPIALVASLASSACLVVALAALYRPDTPAWFREAETA